MQKKHVSPEFTVIKQNEANAKFFVASFMGSGQDATSTKAAHYDADSNNSTVNENGGFTF